MATSRAAPSFALRVQSAARRTQVRIGAANERFVAALHHVCALRGVAWVTKMPTPYRVVRPLGHGLLVVPEARSGVDYVGHMADGRAVYVETKRCSGRRFELRHLPPHQRETLSRAAAAGCVAVLLVIYGRQHAVCAVPWSAVPTGAVSLGPEDLTPHLVPPGQPYLARFARGGAR